VLQVVCAIAGGAADQIVIAATASRAAKSAPMELRLRIQRPLLIGTANEDALTLCDCNGSRHAPLLKVSG
jgi:hypothetical protein